MKTDDIGPNAVFGIVPETESAGVTAYVVDNQHLNPRGPTEVTGRHFGANVLLTQDTEFVDGNSALLKDVRDLGVSTIRFPGGAVTENVFDMTHPNRAIAPDGIEEAGDPIVPLEDLFRTLGNARSDITLSLVVPTRMAFTNSAAEAALTAPGDPQSYGNRTRIDPDYIGTAWDGHIATDKSGTPKPSGPDLVVDGVLGYVSYALALSKAYGVDVVSLEIGNEFWGSGAMTASEYGLVAGTVAAAIDTLLASPEYAGMDVEIVVQSVSSASSLYSPANETAAYVAEIDGTTVLLSRDSIDAPASRGGYGGVVDPDWTPVVIPGQGSAREQLAAIVTRINSVPGAADAIDAVSQHFYVGSGLDRMDASGGYTGPDLESVYRFSQYSFFKSNLDRSNPDEVDFHISEWNARYVDYVGLKQASTMVEMLYELVENGASAAQTWPLTFDIQGRSLVDVSNPRGGLSIPGEMFRMLSESLIGLKPVFDFAATSGTGKDMTWIVDTHGFGSDDRLVIFASERTGVEQPDISLDLSSFVAPDRTYFITSRELWDGGAGGSSALARPVLSDADGETRSGPVITFGLQSWANRCVEITYVGEGDDTVAGRDGNDRIDVFGGNDRVRGARGNDDVTAGAGDDIVFGGSDDDTLNGNFGNDRLFGGRGDDALSGGFGDDLLIGGAGVDTLHGGAGADVFRFKQADLESAGSDPDVILDFTIGEDRICLSRTGFGDFSFIRRLPFSGTGSEVAIVETAGGSTLVSIDYDGDARSDASILLQGLTGLTQHDFMF